VHSGETCSAVRKKSGMIEQSSGGLMASFFFLLIFFSLPLLYMSLEKIKRG
jgi:hypothetical protein